ncbi:MAG: Rieske (2Fe-2S) protein [Polyangiales bacterium]
MSLESTSSPELSRRALLLVGASAAVVACGAEVNGGDTDASAALDAGSDAGADAARPDTASADVARPDASVLDATQPDVAVMDVSRPDTAVMDVSRPDVPVDLGAPDTGPPPCMPPAAAVRIGPIVSFPVGRWVAVTAQAIIIGRDARGIFAYSNVCPHRSCAVPAPASAAGTSRCPCHGAIFTSEGAVVSGPTTRPLVNYPVVVCNSNVYVDKTRTVAMGTRTPVP